MERIKYLRHNGIMGFGSGFLLMLYTAEHLTCTSEGLGIMPFMLVISAVMLFAGIRDFIAASVLQDEEDEKVEGNYWS